MCSCPKGEPPLTISFGIEPVNAVFTGQTVTYEATNCGLPLYSDVILTPNVTWTAIGGDAGPANGTGGSTAVTLSSPTIVNVAFTAWASSAAPPFDAIANCGAIVSAFAIEHTVRPRSGGPPPKDPHRKKLLFGEQVDLEVKGSPFGTITWEFDSPAEDIGSLSPTSGGTTLYTAPAAMPAGGPTVRIKVISTPPEGQGTPVSTTIEFTIVRILIWFEAWDANLRGMAWDRNEPITPNKRKVLNPEGKWINDWMPGHGVRIFPDAKDRNDQRDRNSAKVVVQTAPGASDVIFVKAFDVDDPTVDPVAKIDLNATAGTGVFSYNNSRSAQLQVGDDGFATLPLGVNLDFVVGWQPGENYRIAASFDGVGLGSDLEPGNLQSRHSNEANYVSPDDSQPSDFNGVVSELLTVWRKLHVEADSMSLWTGKKPSPERADVEIDHWQYERSLPVATLKKNTIYTPDGPVVLPALYGPNDFYAGGWLSKNGKKQQIIANTADTVTMNVMVPAQFEDLKTDFAGVAEVYDDDDAGLRTSTSTEDKVQPLPRTDLITSGVNSKFGPAYIEVVELKASDGNSNRYIPFENNSNLKNPFVSLDDSQELGGADREKYWYHFLSAAYQPAEDHDGDPNNLRRD
jgi:hypothetical protein